MFSLGTDDYLVSCVNMDHDMFGVPIEMAGPSSCIIDDDIPSHTTQSLVESDSYHLNNQDQVMAGFPVLSTMHGPPVTDLYAAIHMTNRAVVVDSYASRGKNIVRDNSNNGFTHDGNTELEEQFTGGTVISGASLATLLASRSSLQENISSSVTSAPSLHFLDVTRTHALNDYSDSFNICFATSTNCGYDEVVGNVMGKWDLDKFPARPELGGKSLDSNEWISSSSASISADTPYVSSKLSNELSLSLATSQSSVCRTSIVPDQCSVVTHHCLNETGMGSEQNSCNSKELSRSFGSQKPPQFAQATLGSRYLKIIQEILAQIASYSMENLDEMSYSTDGFRTGSESDIDCPPDRGMFACSEVDDRFEVQMDPGLQKQVVEMKKTQLLTLLQMVDDQYNQCMDEIHTIISAFHAVTELDPQKHGSFALRTISCLYKNLRERISNQILSMGSEFNVKGTREKKTSFEASFIQKQWALQQQKRKEHQLWRPQRGLPEKSVSVLRAWLFQNFLHPYPKDAEKHLLAVKSGLSRNQVSNWFINARVRLWKPMIEEMCSEMNKREARDEYEEGSNNVVSRGGHRNMNDRRFSMNWG